MSNTEEWGRLVSVAEHVSSVLSIFRVAEIARLFDACDIATYRHTPRSDTPGWFIKQSLSSLDWTDAVDELRLQILCKLVVKEARARVASSRRGPTVLSSELRNKVEDLESSMCEAWGRKSHGSDAEKSRFRA